MLGDRDPHSDGQTRVLPGSTLGDGCMGTIVVRAVPEIILGVGRRHFFVLWGGCFVDNVSEGWGVEGNLSWGSRHISSMMGQVN